MQCMYVCRLFNNIEFRANPPLYTIRSHQLCYDDCSHLFHIQNFFWQESENEINYMINTRVREIDMNAFCCLHESEK
jgi:hypothetical protein